MHGKLKLEYRKQNPENRSQKFSPHPCGGGRLAYTRIEYRAFTITEVVVASALLIIATVPILKGLTNAHLNTAIIERKTRSLTLAQAKLDEIKARSVYHYSDTFTETNSALDGSYLGNVTDASAGANLRTITVSVGYDLNGNNILANDEIEVTLATYVAKRWDS